MIYEIGILLCIFLLGGIGIWFAHKFLKKKQRIAIEERKISQELLDEFNHAEQKMKGGLKEDGTTTSPYKILWDLARKKGRQGNEGTDIEPIIREQTIDSGELSEQPSRREDIPNRVTPDTSENKSIIREHKPNNFRRIISRIRRG